MDRNKTNFDRYLERKLQDPAFQQRFAEADRAWDVALQLSTLRKQRGLTQKQVAELLGTKQQAVARMENPAYSGHSLAMIRKYVEVLGATIDLTIVPDEQIAEYLASGCEKPLLAHA